MSEVTRRDAIKLLATTSGAVACSKSKAEPVTKGAPEAAATERSSASVDPVISVAALRGSPWPTQDPFLFCAHHDDHYPAGNESMGPAASLEGRDLGRDFAAKDGWSMYHGRTVPGFPKHPHRGFETVTVVTRGLLDHADSLGAAARYGEGDVQWLTAGAGIQHAEMFPLLASDRDNPLELFQIWLNLPRKDKMADPHFKMLWASTIPRKEIRDEAGRTTLLTVRAGRLGELAAPSAPPSSWAANPANEVGIWTVKMAPGARWTLPSASRGVHRALYFYRGTNLQLGGRALDVGRMATLLPEADVALENGATEGEILILQGRPIGEPIARRGPFVMNTQEEILQAYGDYRRTRFGGWPWDNHAPIHGREPARFARQADGAIERPS